MVSEPLTLKLVEAPASFAYNIVQLGGQPWLGKSILSLPSTSPSPRHKRRSCFHRFCNGLVGVLRQYIQTGRRRARIVGIA